MKRIKLSNAVFALLALFTLSAVMPSCEPYRRHRGQRNEQYQPGPGQQRPGRPQNPQNQGSPGAPGGPDRYRN